MPEESIAVTIVDASGAKRSFKADRMGLDCGVGHLDVRPGKPAFCRGFEQGVLTLDDGQIVTTLRLKHGMASLNGNAVSIICEAADVLSTTEPFLPPANNCRAQPPATPTNDNANKRQQNTLQHMKTWMKATFVAGCLGLASLLTSCQTASSDASSAVTCDKCKTVWVKRVEQVGAAGKTGAYYALKSDKAMACPDCESAAATFFKTGKLKHSCSHCGGALTHCSSH
jgi:hypothetical protein